MLGRALLGLSIKLIRFIFKCLFAILFEFIIQERLRAKACEELKAESIRANVLRHRLRALPTDVEDEFAAAVRAARQLNHDKIESLKEQLAAVTASIEAADARMAEIRFESSVLLYLYPVCFVGFSSWFVSTNNKLPVFTVCSKEGDQLREEHERALAELNTRMSVKANRCIELNETRDKLLFANKRIVDLEEDCAQLSEDIAQERVQTREEIKRLKRDIVWRARLL